MQFAYGDLEEVTETEATYHIGTAPGSSGSPVLNWDADALAIHKLGDPGDPQSPIPLTQQPDLGRTASLLRAVVDAYLHERPLIRVITSLTYDPYSYACNARISLSVLCLLYLFKYKVFKYSS